MKVHNFLEGQELQVSLSEWLAAQNNMPRQATGRVMKVTEKAILLRGSKTGREVWLPKSHLTVTKIIQDVARPDYSTLPFEQPVLNCEYTRVARLGSYIHVWFPKQDNRSYEIVKTLDAYHYQKDDCWRLPARMDVAIVLQREFAGTQANLSDTGFQELLREHEGMEIAQWALTCPIEELSQPEGMKHNLWEHQLRMYHFSRKMSAAGFFMYMGTGKASSVNSPVLTPGGWKRMGDIQAGDEVVNSQGGVSHVLQVYPQGVKTIFKVSFSDGSSTRVTADHLWTVNSPARKWRGFAARTFTTEQIMGDLRDSSGNCKHYIPMIHPVEFAERDLPIDPYLLGVLLGDGGLSASSIALSNPEPEIMASVAELVPAGVNVIPRAGRQIDYYLSASIGRKNVLKATLRELGLMGHAANSKFIPEQYLFASRAQREALLQGLLDTDGSADKRGSATIEYVTVSPRLARDVAELVQSLGGTATTKTKKPTYTYKGEKREGQLAYRMCIALPNEVKPFRLPRKAELVTERTKYFPSRAIVSIEPDGEEEAQCILVDAPDHLYVTDSYILTHNTLALIATFFDWVREHGVRSMLIIAPKTVVDVWPEEFANHSNIPVRVVPLNQPYKSVAWRTEYARKTLEEARRDDALIVHVINYESVWRPPFGRKYEKRTSKKSETSYNVMTDKGFALQAGYDVVVLDESHKIKDHNGSAAKFCHELGKITRFRAILTGTPIAHDVMDLYSQYLFLDPTVFGSSVSAFRDKYAVQNYFGAVTGVQNEAELNRLMYSRAFRVNKDVLKLPPAVHMHRDGELTREEARAYLEMDENMVTSIYEMEEAKQKRDRIRYQAKLYPADESIQEQLREAGEEVRIRTTLAMTKTMKLAQIASGFVIDEEKNVHDIGSSRLDLLDEVADEISSDEPLVIFCRFTEDVRRVKERMTARKRRVAELSGKMDQLQEWRAGQYDVLVVQIKSGGVGINLTKCGDKPCHYCIYYSKDYDWGQYEQSLSRAHRAGQTETVFHIHLRMAEIDHEIEATLDGRTTLFDTILKRRQKAKGVA